MAATRERTTSRSAVAALVLSIVVWTGVAAFAGLVVLRFVAYDHIRYLAALNAQTVWLFLPMYIVASAAWCFRNYALAIVATLIVAFQVVTVVPSIGRPDSRGGAHRAPPAGGHGEPPVHEP